MAFSTVPDRASGDVFTEQMWDDYIKTNFNTGVPVMLANSTLSGSAASIDFSSISQSWAHLMLVIYARSDTAAASTTMLMRFNADTAANYDYQQVAGQAATASAAETFAASSIYCGGMPANTATANVFGAYVIHIPYYSQGTNNKAATIGASFKQGTATTNMVRHALAGFWRSNSAITQITLLAGAGNLVSGSRATLYGMP